MSNIFSYKYKFTSAILMLLTLTLTNTFAKNIVVDATELFSFPGTLTYMDNKNQLPKTLSAGEKVKPIMLSDAASESIFNANNTNIEINNFPVSPNINETVELVKSTSAVRLGTNWTIITAYGEKQLKSFEPAFYTGKIKDKENSNVTIFYFNGNLYSIIEQEGFDNYSISPVVGNAGKSAHILTSQQTSLLGKDYNPFFDVHLDNEQTDYNLIKKLSEKTLSTELLQADIIIEATNDFYVIFNDMNKVTAYIGAVMSHASQIFESNVYIQLFVSQVVIHQDKASDPYRSTTQIYERLYQLKEQWRKKTVKRAIVCLMTDIDYQGGSGGYRVGGVSLGLGTLCNNNQAYCVFGMQGHYNYPTTNYTWDVSVSAHELGHAFGSPHTHNCYFAPNMIDTCITKNLPQEDSDGCVTTGNPIPRPGTLMSYCHLTNSTRTVGLYFHERVKPIIRGFSEQASCLKSAVDPTLILLNPSGGSVLFPGDQVTIKWASSKVEFVAIKYTMDDGASWHWIEKYAEAIDGTFSWIVPDTITNNLKIFIQDSYNAYVNDETEISLTIDKPHFLVQSPADSERIGRNINYRIKWEQKYLDNFLIEFTSDADKITSGEGNWTLITSGISGYSYDWNVPDIESENCLIRIKGNTEAGADFTEVSGKFAIGIPNLKIMQPAPYDKLCAGQDYEIRWESDFISGMYLQYTTDNGEKWKQVKFSSVNGVDGSYLWTVPKVYTDNCLLRFSNFDNRNIIYAISDKPFIIDSCETKIDELGNEINNTSIEIIDIVPNPATNNVTITFNYKLNLIQPVELAITNEAGSIVESLRLTGIATGLNTKNLNLNKLAQGNYYLILQTGKEKTGAALKIFK
ncbi:MAG: M12 family metallo-peptidase [bacterium]